MNQYASMAMKHWRTWLPEQFSTIQDPEAFFSTLGEEAQNRIGELSEQLEGRDQPGEGYLEKVGRLNMARLQAEEIVLREMILLDPEPEAQDQDDDPDPWLEHVHQANLAHHRSEMAELQERTTAEPETYPDA